MQQQLLLVNEFDQFRHEFRMLEETKQARRNINLLSLCERGIQHLLMMSRFVFVHTNNECTPMSKGARPLLCAVARALGKNLMIARFFEMNEGLTFHC